MWRKIVLIIVALAVAPTVQALSETTNGHEALLGVAEEPLNVDRRGTFSSAERNLIRAHLLGNEQALSQRHSRGLSKDDRWKALPHGWQKSVAPGHSLDYHVYRQGESLPDRLLQQLPPSPVGSEILQVENKIIRLNSATRKIIDIFDLVPAP